MKSNVFHSPVWCQALTLNERRSLRSLKKTGAERDIDPEIAERRMQGWKSQVPFGSSGLFRQRLSLDAMDERTMSHILGTSPEVLQTCLVEPPAWLQRIEGAFCEGATVEAQQRDTASREKDRADFLALIEPLVRQGRQRIREGVEMVVREQPHMALNPAQAEWMFFPGLQSRLSMMLGRTLVLELNVARLQGHLEGATAEERFCSFVERLRRPEVALALLQEYPVLARQLTICIDQWVACSLEFLQHLVTDWEVIRSLFSPHGDPGMLVEVQAGAGDTHRGGRSVMIARFSSGLQVVYKPRSLALDVHFQELLRWINEQSVFAPFRTLKIVNRESHGWMEYVEARGCQSADEIQRFYHRQGGYLAILYALEATDFHHENLLAAGEHPVLLDLEALFHPRLEGIDRHAAEDLAGTAFSHSVMRAGLLPQRLWVNAESGGVDISGLGMRAGQLSPHAVGQWENARTDQMRFVRKRVPMKSSAARPSLSGTESGVLDHAEELVDGFTEMYRLLLQNRDGLLRAGGILARFAEDEVRVILRPTNSYATILYESLHPDVLRDALERERLFDRLWTDVEHLPHLARVISAEQKDLWQGDIPIFKTRPGSRDLWTSSNESLRDFFQEPSMRNVQQRFRTLSERDLTSQIWFIRGALATMPDAKAALEVLQPAAATDVIADRQSLLDAACAAGDRLEAIALRDKRQALWIGLSLVDDRNWAVLPLGADLYSGTSGVALFLAYLGAVTGKERYTKLAEAACNGLRNQIRKDRSQISGIGAFTGWGGIIYTLAHLSALWGRGDLLKEAQDRVDLLSELIDHDERHDLIDGAAGCLGGLLSLLRCAPTEHTHAAAAACGEHLLACAKTMTEGIAWTSKIGATCPLTGFAHGAAGIAWALLELAAVTGEERFRKAAQAGMTYERSLFVPEENNWPDFRVPVIDGVEPRDFKPGFGTSWCNGAPGIGLGRLRALRHLHDRPIRDEVDAALESTLARGFNRNDCLCHGDLGNLELLLEASLALDNAWHVQTYRRAANVLARITTSGWRCGNPLQVESPGLMTGVAGIGYGLLRLAEPDRVPSVLTLDPPLGATTLN